MASDPLTSSAAGIALVGAVGQDYGRIMRANHRLADLLGRPLEEIVGTRLCEHLHSNDQAQTHSAFLRLMADTQTLYQSKGRLVAATARVVQVQAFASVITTPTGPAVVLRVLALPSAPDG
jgi:PAS domain-containing protein